MVCISSMRVVFAWSSMLERRSELLCFSIRPPFFKTYAVPSAFLCVMRVSLRQLVEPICFSFLRPFDPLPLLSLSLSPPLSLCINRRPEYVSILGVVGCNPGASSALHGRSRVNMHDRAGNDLPGITLQFATRNLGFAMQFCNVSLKIDCVTHMIHARVTMQLLS